MPAKNESILRRLGGRLHKVIPLLDDQGEIVHYHAIPLRLELTSRDVMQIIAGAALLSIPVAFTQEAWDLGASLPMVNVLALFVFSVLVISGFVYFNSYRQHFREYWPHFLKRVLVTYLAAFAIVGLLLTLIQQCPWGIDNALAIKRILIVSFPASISASISDMLE